LLLPRAAAYEFHDPVRPLDAIVAEGQPRVWTSRRVDQRGLHYALETTGALNSGWSPLASYRGDGSAIGFDAAGYGVMTTPMDTEFERLGFYPTNGTQPAAFYRVAYRWLQTVASAQTGTWSSVSWSNGEPVRQMDAVLANRSALHVPDADAAANHLSIGTLPGGSSLTVNGGNLTVQGRVVVGSAPTASGRLTVEDGSFTVNAAACDDCRTEIGRYESPVAGSRGLSAKAVFAGGTSRLGDIRFNLNPFRSTGLELVGGSARVDGGSLWGRETDSAWLPGQLTFTLDEAGLAPLALSGSLDLGAASNHFDLAVDARRYAGEPRSFPLILADAIQGDWASTRVTGFPADRTLYLSHADDRVTLTMDAPMAYYLDALDATYVRLRSRDQEQYLLHPADSTFVHYESGAELADVRSHWELRLSPQADRVWILNRATGKSIQGVPLDGTLHMADLQAAQEGFRWSFHRLPGSFRIEGGWEPGQVLSVGDAAAGTAVLTSPAPGDSRQQFVIKPVPRGAIVPWTTYDEDTPASLGDGARRLPPTYDRLQTHAEAQKRGAVLLAEEGAFVTWTLVEPANALVVRYAIEDSPTGGGLNGALTMEIRDGGGGLLESTLIPVSSEQAWVYFDADMNESDDPARGRPAKRFNEARVRPSPMLLPGYHLTLRRGPGQPLIWIDLVETETAPPPIPMNAGDFLSIAEYGAIPDDGLDDLPAVLSCIAAARRLGKGVYIPAGVFALSSRIPMREVTVQGAGMWHTELHFTTRDGGVNTVGFWGEGGRIGIHDIYLRTPSTTRTGGGNAFQQLFGPGSRITGVWLEQFTVGAWIGDYTPPYDVSDGLTFANCRIRNTFADGINFARGTRNATIENCHFRGNGDDAAATWSSDADVVDMCRNNVIRYNTIECNYRAAGIGVFGGEGHRIHHNIVRDVVAGAAMRFNTTFAADGYAFGDAEAMAVYKNSLYRSGTRSGYGAGEPFGAINLRTRYGDVRNIRFEDILIDDVEHYGIWIDQHEGADVFGSFSNLVFTNIRMVRVPVGIRVNNDATGEIHTDNVHVELDPVRGTAAEENLSPAFQIVPVGDPPTTNAVIRL
jgi:hypothetical protein